MGASCVKDDASAGKLIKTKLCNLVLSNSRILETKIFSCLRIPFFISKCCERLCLACNASSIRLVDDVVRFSVYLTSAEAL